jgi:hypothetical protein
VKVASNPTPVECRCLAASPDGRLGADTYDCGAVFTRPISGDQEPISHGRVWFDDHRANYGPAAFAGVEGRYFLANHGEDIRVARLWATDVRTNRHHRLAEHAALQLVRLTDGRVAGTLGPNPPVLDFDPTKCWAPSWVARPGPAFVYEPGETRVRMLPTLETAGPIAAWRNGRVLVAIASRLLVYDLASQRVEREIPLPASAIAAASDPTRDRAYVLLEGGAAQVLAGDEPRIAARVPFGPSGRGFFVVPSGSLVGIAHDGGVTVLRPGDTQPAAAEGPAPLPAGPAVDPRDDAWYFAHRSVTRYELGS